MPNPSPQYMSQQPSPRPIVKSSGKRASRTSFGTHISTRYDAELEDIRARALAMGSLVEQQLADALQAISSGDEKLARKIIRKDKEVNQAELALDESCICIIAQRQPAASDLRLIIAITRTITDLERIGDEARRIAYMAADSARRDERMEQYRGLRQLGLDVHHMLHEALKAFAHSDVESAIRVLHEDNKVDQEYKNVLREAVTVMQEDSAAIPRALDMLWSARSLERIGDRACNIAQYAIYFVKGEDVRHMSLDDINSLRVP